MTPLPELWGGVECTINRVGDDYHDQLRRSGHLERFDDIARFAALGLRALRVPVLWEQACVAGETPSFTSAAPLLARIAQHGMRPIAGLVHHGSGPRHTNLLDPDFARKLALYAGAVARRFPEIVDYTPVNEPLTTARFSALYGHWFPHARSGHAFLLALLNECLGTLLAMRAVREVRPDARLIQTEDIATVRSTPLLDYQAEHENHRRYLSFDLLCGRVDHTHALYPYLRANGIGDAQLAPFLESPCPPDLIGLNYYFTSDRYLDEDLAAYPCWSHGGNGRHAYADMDAGHVGHVGLVGHECLLRGVWERYRIPLAITEVHSGCTREEQLRWFHEAWQAACSLRRSGIPVHSVTAWALLGSYDWNSLVCEEAGIYETGVYDLRAEHPRPTALAQMVRSLSTQGTYDHAVLDSPGWWRRGAAGGYRPASGARPILITGARGALAGAMARACDMRGLAHVALDRAQLDITRPDHVDRAIAQLRPWAIINAAGFSGVAEAEKRAEQCRQVNTEGAVRLAEACKRHGIRLMTFSSDQVFDGLNHVPYLESSPVSPRSVYGVSQAEAEQRVLTEAEDTLVVRTSALFGAPSAQDSLTCALQELARGRPVYTAREQSCSPTFVPDLVDASLDLLIDGARGRWHLANAGAESWHGLLLRVTRSSQIATEGLLRPCLERGGPYAPYSVLASERAAMMPSLEDAIMRYVRDTPAAASGAA